MDIATMSVQMSMTQLHMNAGYALAGKIMDTTQTQAAGLLDMMQQAAPSFGHSLDIRV